MQSDGTNTLEFIYDGNGLCGVKCNNENYLYRKNAQGDITHILDNTGMVVAKYVYDAWGNHAILDANGNDLASGVGVLNPFRYRGYFYGEETDLYYLQTRYYDPELGRFISQDDVSYLAPDSINGLNLYAYCGNNPVMNVDPTGCFGILALLAIGLSAFLIGGAGQFISNAAAGKTGSELWRGVLGAAFGATVNALLLCLTMPLGGVSLIIGAAAGAVVQTGIDILETVIRGEEVNLGSTFIDLGVNFVTTLVGNYIGSKLIPINSGWFQPQKFLSVFLKPYGQRILLQTIIGSALSAVVNLSKKSEWFPLPIPISPIPLGGGK